jgi:hypothetical protein
MFSPSRSSFTTDASSSTLFTFRFHHFTFSSRKLYSTSSSHLHLGLPAYLLILAYFNKSSLPPCLIHSDHMIQPPPIFSLREDQNLCSQVGTTGSYPVQMNSLHTLAPYFFDSHFSILLSASSSCKLYLSFTICSQNFVLISLLACVLYTLPIHLL